ncbi:MAG: YgaP family membrane protein [Planctomycetota bacterium]
MTVERWSRGIAGFFIVASVLPAYFQSPCWLFFTGFVGLNLSQSAFTNWCPMMSVLRTLGVHGSRPMSRK